MMYADDTVIYVSGKGKGEIEKSLTEDCESSAQYFDDNALIKNLKKGKTESMIFGTSKRLKTTDENLSVTYRGQSINNVKQYKYLGNNVDRNLNFNKNFDSTYKRASSRLNLLSKLRYFLTREAAFSIYKMMIIPILTYRCPVKLYYTSTQQKQVKSLERRAKRIIGKTFPSIVNSIRKEALGLVAKSLNDDSCSNFNGYFKVKRHLKATRNNGYLVELPKTRLELGKRSFKYSGAKIFNELPLDLRKNVFKRSFAQDLKEFFNLNN